MSIDVSFRVALSQNVYFKAINHMPFLKQLVGGTFLPIIKIKIIKLQKNQKDYVLFKLKPT